MASTEPSDEIEISGSVGRLYPGAAIEMPLSVANPTDRTLVVDDFRVGVSHDGGCGTFVTVDVDAWPELAPAATTIVDATVRLDHAAPDACQSVTMLLAYTILVHDPESATTAPVAPAPLATTGGVVAGPVSLALAAVALGAALCRATRRAT